MEFKSFYDGDIEVTEYGYITAEGFEHLDDLD